jgi:hypothetical protein
MPFQYLHHHRSLLQTSPVAFARKPSQFGMRQPM